MEIFKNFGLSQELVSSIKELGIVKPTQIQELSIPHIMNKKDVIGESATGSGKTLAFGCGIVEGVNPGKGLQAMILTPTRELAEQVKESLKKLSRQLKIIPVYGGVAINKQIHELQRADVVVATPGRLLDHLQRRTINTSKISILVIDEADRMFDMGFIDDVEKIIRTCPKQRQTLFFSATISTRVKSLANRHMNQPEQVSAVKHVDASKLKQIYYNINGNMKISLLIHLLKQENSGLVMVFCNTRRNTDFVTKNLKGNGINAIAIHGGLSQNKRSRTLDTFNSAKVSVLVCTDIAARGLHIDNVSHVYNFEAPRDPKDYVHRIGRTARAGEEGQAINFIGDRDHSDFSRILSDYRTFNVKNEKIPSFERIKNVQVEDRRNRGGHRGFSDRGRNRRGFSDGGNRGRFSGGGRNRFSDGNRSRDSDGNRGRFSNRSSDRESDRGRFSERRNDSPYRPRWGSR